MSWLRTDDTFCQHPKFEGWTKAQKWDWLEVMHYCARYQTGGRIPNDLAILPRSANESLLKLAEKSGWIDRDPAGDRWVHDWKKYQPTDPTKAERQAKWRANRNGAVDTPVDKSASTEPSTPPSTSRARFPSPTPTEDQEHLASNAVSKERRTSYTPSYEGGGYLRGTDDGDFPKTNELTRLGDIRP